MDYVWMLNVLDLMYVWMLNECVCRCGHLLCEILYAHVFCVCYVYAQFIVFGEPRTSTFSQLTPTPGAYWNPLPRSDEVPKLGVL